MKDYIIVNEEDLGFVSTTIFDVEANIGYCFQKQRFVDYDMDGSITFDVVEEFEEIVHSFAKRYMKYNKSEFKMSEEAAQVFVNFCLNKEMEKEVITNDIFLTPVETNELPF